MANSMTGYSLILTLALAMPMPLRCLKAQDTLRQRPTPAPNDETSFRPQVDPSYFWAAWPSGAWYEGNIRVPIFLRSRSRQITERGLSSYPVAGNFLYSAWRACSPRSFRQPESINRKVDRRFACTLAFVPHFVVRQTKEASSPVRTPTFNPGFEWTFHTLWIDSATQQRLAEVDTFTDRRRATAFGQTLKSSNLTMLSLHARLGHYSNGQSGCLYAVQAYSKEDDKCFPAGVLGDSLNRTDGSFSLHYWDLGASYSWLRFDGQGSQHLGTTLVVAYRYHLGSWLAGGISDELREEYGSGTVTAALEQRWFVPYDGTRTMLLRQRMMPRVRAETECAIERKRDTDTCRFEAVASLSFPAFGGLA